MQNSDHIPGLTDDPIVAILLRGEATSLHEAEEKYLDSAMPDVLALLASGMSNEELENHPLFQLLVSHGSRGWEDSIL